MSTQNTLPIEQQQPVKNHEKERDVIFTANGSGKAAHDIYRTGALVGMESMNTRPPDNIPVEFVDWPFSKLGEFPDVGELFDAHLKVVRGEQPRYAVAPDIDATVSSEDGLAWAEELQDHCETVIVVPKTVRPIEVPDRYRVGMPCQERYGPTPWQWPEYQECESVHLLGGSPKKHHEILKHYVAVESLDTTSPLRAASFGGYWDGDGWTSVDGDELFYWCLKQSYRNMRHSMNPRRRVWDPRARNSSLDYESAFRDLDDTGLFDHDEYIPRPGRAAYYVCNGPTELAEYVLNEVR